MQDELTLVAEAQKGAGGAFTALLRQHQGRVRAYLTRFVRGREIVDDLAQETFLSAFRSLANYKATAPFGIWLLGIARNRALEFLRGEQNRRNREANVLAAALAEWRAERVEKSEAAHDEALTALRECVKTLPAASSQILDEFYQRNRQISDIARHLGKKDGAIRMTLVRLRDALRECIERRMLSQGAPA